jgi:uncharacterized repeat protein (TIGR01451 family)
MDGKELEGSLMSVARKGVWTTLVAVVCGAGLLAGAGSALAETKEFKYTGTEQQFKVPAGVTSVQVMAIGGAGGSGLTAPASAPGGAGGLGAVVSGSLGVTAGETLYVEVGGNGASKTFGAAGGFNGGGSTGFAGGGGGGASDVRTVSIGAEPSPGNKESLEHRLLVAAGGGGGGEGECTGEGGAGGNAEEGGHKGVGCSSSGGGGGAGTATKGGAGGTAPPPSGGIEFLPGEEGALGKGGSQGSGGGGGGLYGGGSGGEGFAGGGGGGGSNLVPPVGEAEGLAEAAPEGGFVTITYTANTPPDLSLKNVASPSPVLSGNTLTYTLTVTNTGTETANEVTLADLLPESAVFKSLHTTQGTCIRKAGQGPPKTKDGGVFCKLGSLEGGKTATVTITVTPTTPGTLNAKASVKASNVTSDANDEETATTKVLGD